MRERERAIEAGRQLILRLLGEASTLKNQLAQIDEYLAGIERETARADARRAGGGRRDRAAGGRAQAALGDDGAAPAGAGIGHRRAPADGRGSGGAAPHRGRTAPRDRRASKTEVSPDPRAQGIAGAGAGAPHLHHRIGEAAVRVARKGQGRTTSSRSACWPITWKSTRSSKSRRKSSCTRSWNTWWSRDWQQAERGLDFIRAELDGRATFLVHPEPDGNGHGRLPEPAIGPETGIAARLSDSLRLTNGFKDRAVDLLPRVSLCFLAEDRDGGAAALGGISAPVLPAARRRLLSRPHGDRRQEIGRRTAGDEARGARTDGEAAGAAGRAGRDAGAARRRAARRSSASKPSWSGCARCSSRARRTALALDHDMRKLGEDLSRANSRLSVARLELERLRRDAEKSAEQRERNRAAVAEKERLRARARSSAGSRAAGARKAGRPGGDHRRRARGHARRAGRTRRAASRRADAPWARLEQQFRETTNRRNAIAPEIERLGEQRVAPAGRQYRAGSARPTLLAEQITALEARVNEMAAQDAGMREALRAGEEELKALRAAGAGVRTRSGRRSKSTWCASRPS